MNLTNFFACPKCKGNLINNVISYSCNLCEETYSIEADIPIFLTGVKTDVYSDYWNQGWQDRFNNGDMFFHKQSKEEYYEIVVDRLKQSEQLQTPITSLTVQQENQSVLNIGCGLNESSLITMMGVNNYIGIDYSFSAAKYSLDGIQKLSGHGITIQANAENLPIKSKSISQVFSNGVLHHTPNIVVTLDEIHRVLKPSGIGVIGLYSKYSPKFIVAFFVGTLKGWASRKKVSWFAHTEEAWKVEGLFNPWTKTFSRKEIILMFKKYNYSDIKIRSTGFQWGDSIPIIGKYFGKTRIGKKSAMFLSKKMGSMLVITFVNG